MKGFAWFLINVLQVCFFLFWSFLLQSLSILTRFLTGSQWLPLLCARYLWAPALVGITRSPVRVRGLEQIDLNKPHIFICNHQSTLDIAVAFVAIPKPLRFVAKKELLYVPFLGWYMWATGMIFVNRKKSEEARKSLERAGKIIREGADVIAFAEGTRSEEGEILPFKKGIFVVALEAGVPIVPMSIEGTRFVMPKNTFRIRPHQIDVVFGKPIETKDLTYEQRNDLINKTRNTIIDLNLSVGGLGGKKESSLVESEIATKEQEGEIEIPAHSPRPSATPSSNTRSPLSSQETNAL
jgi:1-acyl-sn-glycerol-3-phosphate acyltransferase